jgi:hypothetical protein
MDPVIGSGEGNGLLRPTHGLRWFSVDELDLAAVLAVPPPAHATLEAANDHVDQSLGVLECAIGVACLRWRRLVALFATILRRVVVTSPFVTAVVVLAATSIIAAVVVVGT